MISQKSIDQEQITLDFLKEDLLRYKIPGGWEELTLDGYYQSDIAKKMFAFAAYPYLGNEAQSSLQQRLWSSPYGYYYMWQFLANGVRFFNDEETVHITELLNKSLEGLNDQLDYGRFNHFGRMMALLKINIYVSGESVEARGIVNFTKMFLLDIDFHNKNLLAPGMNGLGDLGSMVVESCEMSCEVIDTLKPAANASILFSDDCSAENVASLKKELALVGEFVNKLKEEDYTKERTKLLADIERDLGEMNDYLG